MLCSSSRVCKRQKITSKWLYIFDCGAVVGAAYFQKGKSIGGELNRAFCRTGYKMGGWGGSGGGKELNKVRRNML